MREDRDANRGKQKGIRGPGRRQTPLTCNCCWRVFARREHLTRHLRVHTRERPFTCDICGKEFSRMDILNRHSRIHTQQRPEVVTSCTQRSAACLQCATSRVRCTRGDPCARCESKGLSCEPRILPAKGQAVGTSEDGVVETDMVPNPHVSQAEQTPTRSLEPAAVLGDGTDWAQDPRVLSGPPVHDVHDGNPLDPGMTFDLDMYEVDSTDGFATRPLSAINWLSPDDRSFQEWASHLGGFPGGGVFPTSFAMPDVPGLPQCLGTAPTLECAPPASRSSTDNAQAVTLAEITSCPEGAVRESPETLMDGASSRSSQATSNRYYVHGIAWRAPFQSRFRQGQAVSSVDRGSVTTSAPSTASIGSVTNVDETASPLSKWLAEDIYDRIVLGVEGETQTSSYLPSLQAFRLCVQLYFERLHPNFPFLSKAAFISEKPHWILSLAVAGVGAAYLRSSQGSQWKDIMMQALEGILFCQLRQFQHKAAGTLPATHMLETASQAEELLPLIQAKVLHLLCMLHSSPSYISQRAVFERAALVQWCSYLNLVPDSMDVFTLSTGGKDVQQWINAQSSLRTGMTIWLLDSMVSYELNCNHLMKLGDVVGCLPSHEVAWEQPSPENIAFAESVSIPFLDALDMVYIEKRLPPHLSQFSQILLVHAIYQRTTEAADQSRMRLSSWSPTDSVQLSGPRPASTQMTWPPSSSFFVKWRNAACDSLDVLHCIANSRAAESCWEEPTIMYLHLARLILLSPFVHFRTLAQDPLLHTRSGSSVNASHLKGFEHARSQVFQWAIRDQFKARLSVVHAGALLWHVRRFSTDNAVEPFAVYIATLLLWAYSLSIKTVKVQGNTTHRNASCSHPPSPDQIPGDASMADDDITATDQSDAEPRLIYLDRPLDDELVQMYIRVGNKVSAQLKGVGDISGDGAPVKILKQGFYLLTGERHVGKSTSSTMEEDVISHVWNTRQLYAKTIRCLIEAS